MRLQITTALCLLATPLWGQTVQEKSCLFNAALKLPQIPGLVIQGGRVTPEKAPGTYRVEIDVRAIGQDATMIFACASGQGGTLVQPAGMR
jgi:hypothetical protein